MSSRCLLFKNSDTGTRNTVCDKTTLKELKGIYNPSIRDRSIVSKLIGTKVKFGMGVKKNRHDRFSGRVAQTYKKTI